MLKNDVSERLKKPSNSMISCMETGGQFRVQKIVYFFNDLGYTDIFLMFSFSLPFFLSPQRGHARILMDFHPNDLWLETSIFTVDAPHEKA